MNTNNKIEQTVDQWIYEEELPNSATIKPLSRFDDLYPKDPEEYQAYCEFIQWGCTIREHIQLMSLPRIEKGYDFMDVDFAAFAEEDSAYNTMDFKRLYPSRFNKYNYRIRKIYERLTDLAQTYSCISHKKGKENIAKRFNTLVTNEFRDQFNVLLDTLRNYPYLVERNKVMKRVTKLVKNIEKSKQIWQDLAFSD